MTDLPEFKPEDQVEVEVFEYSGEAASEHTIARHIALQALYEIDSTQHPADVVIRTRLQDADVKRKIARYVERLVAGVVENRTKLDSLIQFYAPEWPLEQVAVVDRNILRMALYEFAIQSNTPVRVVIAEAVELARLFGAEGAPRFVNGVLGSLADNETSVRQQLTTDSGEL